MCARYDIHKACANDYAETESQPVVKSLLRHLSAPEAPCSIPTRSRKAAKLSDCFAILEV